MKFGFEKYFVIGGIAMFAALAMNSGCSDDDSGDNGGAAGSSAAGGPSGGGADGSGGGTASGGGSMASDAFCQEACESDDDCKIEGAGDFECTDNRCSSTATATGCENDNECIAQMSGWAMDCTEDSECFGGIGACVKVGEAGKCALVPSETVPCTAPMVETTATKLADDSDVTVCGRPDATCGDDGVCKTPCGSDDDCAAFSAVGQTVCDMDTGNCVCGESTCGDVTDASTCDTDSGRCVCASDDDCTTGGDVCADSGVCGCSTVDVCSPDTVFDGTTKVCE